MFQLQILPSAMLDIAQTRFFYEEIEPGLGDRFRDDIFNAIDNLSQYAGIHEIHLGYYRAIANRFHQNIYYKINGDVVTVWRVLDQRFNPKRIREALFNN
ncbi:MAG: type II toxin-antitoxin system RelE/ParE family toxin [Kiritimatiellae bacterium]|nr:type II toxin-antitoxin system RelE/ParE family toxin [Kiritimatiellia bacterium]